MKIAEIRKLSTKLANESTKLREEIATLAPSFIQRRNHKCTHPSQ
jgi:hypothetical protein